ncbi:MAG TPA: dTDP-4-dehydrorhamnose reductase [Flavobacteriaceae bacterium]|nr:dTDP-4-dehydrorhamnose reductase [Flavobacteriaceae bacterium]
MAKKVLITGADGQLGQCVQYIAKRYPQIHFTFVNKKQLDITDGSAVDSFFKQNNFTYIINAAAYTHVDNAETEQELAFEINEIGVKNIARACAKYNLELLHLSTDYVFDGKSKVPYTEEMDTNPINVYGASKLAGENVIVEVCKKHIILRTSWLYSPFGHNFYLSMRRAIENKKQLQITTEQTGTPTSAVGLAEVLMKIICQEKKEYGVYHYSDEGETTWYEFAMEIERKILEENKGYINPTDHYETKAKRPKYSVLNHMKIKKNFNIIPKPWQKTLAEF